MSLLKLMEKREKEFRAQGRTEKADKLVEGMLYIKDTFGDDANKI